MSKNMDIQFQHWITLLLMIFIKLWKNIKRIITKKKKTIIHGFDKTRLLCSITPYVPKNLFIAMDAINETGFLNQTEEQYNLWENFDIPEEVLVNILFPPEGDGEAYE
ncbi:Hypothetical_protein [Hexamita inflata]|uniref:Hypothetical_protein n=1 Tax=Hexamita inflata TaxID=28002 RepID=A0AA86NE65_9EUKA|nr:Hypothetical protein HINF_LOCUS5306 [Hexamita inflata]